MKLRLLLLTFLFSALSWGQLTEGFESGMPTGYTATTSFTLSSGTWTAQANGLIRGTSGVSSGTYSCQLRSQTGAQITSPNITTGVSTVTFYGSASTTSGSVQVNYSTDGGSNWSAATGSPFSLTNGSPVLKTATINSSSPNILIQFYRTAATVYIDDVNILPMSGCTPATITVQPSTSIQTLCQGVGATALSVTASGTTLSYQWYSNTTATNSGGTAVGTNSASYTPSTATAGTLYYYCVVTAACGSPVTSNVSGSVTVNAIPATPSGTINPTQNCGNTSLNYSAPSASLYWQTSPTGTSTTSPTTSAYSVTTNGTYYVRAFNGFCWSTGMVSQAVTVVNPVVISTQPSNQATTVGATATFSVTASNAAGYQWQINTGSGWSNISGATSASYTTPVATLAMNGYQYQVVITGNSPCGNVTSSVANLTVSVGPCHSEGMTALCVSSCTPATSTYATRTWAGDGGTWTATDSRSDQTITASNPAITIRSGAVTSPTFLDGIESITMTTRLPFSDSAGNLTVRVNGTFVGTIPYSTSIQTSTISGINISGSVVITIESSGARVAIDNINWTCFNSNSEIDVQGNGLSIADGDTTPSTTDDTDFGTTTIGNDIAHTFTIYNTGTDPLDISGITISGVNAADFYISVNAASTVAAGGSTTFEVTFSPTVAGTSNATINIANNDADENPYTFDIVAVSTVCTPTTSVSSITPTSGPVGTVVTINGSGFTTATSVSFSGVSASFTIVSNTVIEAIVPAITASGNIVIQDAGGCDLLYSSFTLIAEDNSSCEGIATTTDLIIYDLHDEYTGDGGFITIYNGTASTVDMVDYTLWRTSNYGDGNEIDYANLTGTIAPGALGVIRVNTAGCGPVGTNGTIDNGFNGDDQIQLRNAAGTVVIDDVHTYYNKGYYMVRNTGALSARTSYVAADWSITPLAAGQCWPSAGLVLPSGNGNSPSVTLNPVDVNISCSSSTATLTVAGTEGVAGGNGLAYQWYVNVPGNAGWTAITNGGVYSGATSAALNISSTSGLNNYQYYCQIRENDATCYTATEAAIIKDGATIWNGTTWSNGVPDLTMLAIIDGNYDTALHGDFSCCSLVVNATYRVDVRANNYVEIQNDLTVNGIFKVWDDGSLIQIDDAGVNTGNIRYERITTGTTFDYVYWSSPVEGANTPASGYIYSWNPTVANPNGGWGNWILSRNTPMASGVGYIMRDVFSRTFAGVARNGVVQPTIARANNTGSDFTGTNGTTITNKDDNWNLVGNPYPSAIRALDFITLNTNIEGAVRIWTHGTNPSTSISDPFYDSYVYNYTPNDYIVYNGTGTLEGPAGFNGFIAGGQSFMVSMLDGPAATSTVTFNNAMRSRTYNNEQFYRTSNSSTRDALDTNGEEKNRIWLDIINSNNQSARTLVGYVTGATYQKDRVYDAVTNVLANVMNIYSVLDNERMTIQGRALPFDNTDKVQIAVNITTAGNYSIGIGATDGLFTQNQEIYLEDTELNIIHDLRTSPYSFSIASGEFKDRFVLRYTTETLSNEDFNDNNDVLIFSNQTLNVTSNKLNIKAVTVYNVIGQLLENKKLNNTPNFVSSLVKGNQVLIVRVELENGVTIERKVIF